MNVSHFDFELNTFCLCLSPLGHVQLTYFCSWSDVEESCDKEAIANMYCAPGKINLHKLIHIITLISLHSILLN